MNVVEYARLAACEDRLWHFAALHDHVRRALVRRGLAPGAPLLDAGCGTGGLLRRLRVWFPGADLRGLDCSPVAVELARRRAGCPIDDGSLLKLPYAGGSFEVITCVDVVYQFERPGDGYREAARCLKPGGALLVNEPAYRWLGSYHDEKVGGRHRFTRGEVRAMLRDAGLQPVYATYWNCLALPLIAARRKLLPPPAGGASDVRDYPPWIAGPMQAAMTVERAWLRLGGRWPFGASVFGVGVKSLEREGTRGV